MEDQIGRLRHQFHHSDQALPSDHKGPEIKVPYRKLSYQRLVDDFIAALPAPELADRIMRDNAALFYDF